MSNITPIQRPRWWPILLVLAGVAIALVLVVLDVFRAGSLILGASVIFAAFLRLLLPENQAGLLAVRSKVTDVTTLGLLGLAVTIFAIVVPDPN